VSHVYVNSNPNLAWAFRIAHLALLLAQDPRSVPIFAWNIHGVELWAPSATLLPGVAGVNL
jgi:hypothetical protein